MSSSGLQAGIIWRGISSEPILKYSSERWVCAPEFVSGDFNLAELSVSVRTPVNVALLGSTRLPRQSSWIRATSRHCAR
jgi:hypothetical protein